MESTRAIAAFAAMAHETRLDVFRTLVRAGRPVPAGMLAERLDVPGSTLSFHLKELRLAGLVSSERQGRSLLYAADFDTLRALQAFLVRDCCQGLLP
ncbi:MAG: helix-turn-helix transcriptional regulator [Myxococcales bacterium]|nr:helix-turn-helix transcriptional regulator [Myxococcales bacterium]